MRWHWTIITVVALAAAGCAGNRPEPGTAGGGGTAGSDEEVVTGAYSVPPLNATMLRGASYPTSVGNGGFVQLFQGTARQSGAGGDNEISLLGDPAFGDLDGDGENDAAVILVTKTPIGNVYYELIAVLNQDGYPDAVAGMLLGDRIRINVVGVLAGKIYVTLVRHGPNDPLESPTLRAKESYQLQGRELVRVLQAGLGG